MVSAALLQTFLNSIFDTEQTDSIEQPTGFPQGSILGPLVFILYLNPLFEALDAIGCLYHFYADDSQFFIEIHEGRLTSKCEEVLKYIGVF